MSEYIYNRIENKQSISIPGKPEFEEVNHETNSQIETLLNEINLKLNASLEAMGINPYKIVEAEIEAE